MIYDKTNPVPNDIIKTTFGDRTKYYDENESYTQNDSFYINYYPNNVLSLEKVFNTEFTTKILRIESGTYEFQSSYIKKDDIDSLNVYGFNNPVIKLSQDNLTFTNSNGLEMSSLTLNLFKLVEGKPSITLNKSKLKLSNILTGKDNDNIYLLDLVDSELILDNVSLGNAVIRSKNSTITMYKSSNIVIEDLGGSKVISSENSNIGVRSNYILDTLNSYNDTNLSITLKEINDAFLTKITGNIDIETIHFIALNNSSGSLKSDLIESSSISESTLSLNINTMKNSSLYKCALSGVIQNINVSSIDEAEGNLLINKTTTSYVNNSSLNLQEKINTLIETNIAEEGN